MQFENNNCNRPEDIVAQKVSLTQVIDNSYDSIFVTDKHGNVLLVNTTAVRMMRAKREELVGANVNELVKSGLYNRSTAMEAAQQRSVVTGLVKMRDGINLLSTSMPLLDDKGEVTVVITNTRDKDLVEKYVAALEDERARANRYKKAVEYLSELKTDKGLVAESPVMQRILGTVEVVAKVDSTIMLLGESGTGKEVIARHIHKNSLRSREPFIPVNCAAIPHDLLESEFFGYVRGAFTGANTNGKPGLFEIAHNGTMFLDEIGELPLALQSKLLRVLETGEVQRLGAKSSQQTNVRLIAATNRDLKSMMDQNLFRSDLYFRLHVIPINLPPLRERPEDIVALAHVFVGELNKKYSLQKILTPYTIQGLLRYNWPGNVRELRNVIERLAITSSANELILDDSTLFNVEPSAAISRVNRELQNYQGTLKDLLKVTEENYINQVLQECEGRVGKSAQRLGIHRTVLYRKLCQTK